MGAIKLITAPSVEPLTLQEAKDQLRINTTDQDARITAYIAAARQFCENFTNRAFITQTWELWLDSISYMWKDARGPWWDGTREGPLSLLSQQAVEIDIPRPPLISLVTVTTFDVNDNETTFYDSGNTASLETDTISEPGRIHLTYGTIWPGNLRRMNAVRIQYQAGYGATSDTVPGPIKVAIAELVTHYYENRGDSKEAPPSVEAMLNPYVVRTL